MLSSTIECPSQSGTYSTTPSIEIRYSLKPATPFIRHIKIQNRILWIHHHKKSNSKINPDHKLQRHLQVILKPTNIITISKLESGLSTTKDKICRCFLRLSNVHLNRVHIVQLLPSKSDTLWTHQHLLSNKIEFYTPPCESIIQKKNKHRVLSTQQTTNQRPHHHKTLEHPPRFKVGSGWWIQRMPEGYKSEMYFCTRIFLDKGRRRIRHHKSTFSKAAQHINF